MHKQKPRLHLSLVMVVLVLVIAALVYPFWALGTKRVADVELKSRYYQYSWEELSRISNAISSAKDDEEALEIAKFYNIVKKDGTMYTDKGKEVELSNGQTAHVIIVGIRHDNKSDGSGKAGITWRFLENIDNFSINLEATTEGGWKDSVLRERLQTRVPLFLPEDLRACIVAVDKPAVANKDTNSYAADIEMTSDTLWLFSMAELAGNLNQKNDEGSIEPDVTCLGSSWQELYLEGSPYQLFEELGISTFANNEALIVSNLVAGLGETPRDYNPHWWLRSPVVGSNEEFYYVGGALGWCGGTSSAEEVRGVVPGFCT